MRITLVIHSLSSGGAERVLTLVARGFVQRGHQVSVITMEGKNTDFYSLPQEVERIALDIPISRGVFHATWNNIDRQMRLRRAIRSLMPQVIISYTAITNVRVLLASRGLGIPVIVTEHGHPGMAAIPAWWILLRRWLYPACARLVSVSSAIDRCFAWMPLEKRAVIHNPLPDIPDGNPGNAGLILENRNRKHVVAMGRLHPVKGFDLLIDAFARVASVHPDWDLYILGEGEQRRELESEICDRKLTGRVFLPGIVKQPFPTLREADLFVLPSRSEGFGNALVESMACGLPVISFDCPGGPGEIISHDQDGVLVPSENVDALARAMSDLMSDAGKRQRLGEKARRVRERFDRERILDAWEKLINPSVREREAHRPAQSP